METISSAAFSAKNDVFHGHGCPGNLTRLAAKMLQMKDIDIVHHCYFPDCVCLLRHIIK